jgi:predicted acetyltransferase
MKIEIARATLDQRPVVRHLSEFYMYDFSEMDPETEINDFGTFDYGIDRYWQEHHRFPFLVRVDGKLAGFALVKRGAYLSEDPDMMDMAEFFIMRRHRRRGVGSYVATYIFDLFPAKWEVRQIRTNPNALEFWRTVIDKYTDGRYEEISINDDRWDGTVHYFDNRKIVLPGMSTL